MPKVTVEMNDDLDERVQDCIDELKEMIMEHLEQSAPGVSQPDSVDDVTDLFELCDSQVPVYTKQLSDLHYLHSYELEKAYDMHFGGDFDSDKIGTAILCYIQDEVCSWFSKEIDSIFEEFEATGKNTFKVGDKAIWTNPETDEEKRITVFGFETYVGGHFIVIDNDGSEKVHVDDCRELTYQEMLADV